MKNILEKLFEHKILTQQEAAQVMHTIAKGEASNTCIAALLAAYNMRTITTQELLGFTDAIYTYCQNIEVNIPTIDVCGTGGDGKNSFNISTLAAIAISAYGVPVTKHGNYGASSASGSSTVLEALGYNFSNNNSTCLKQLEATNFTYLHAPLFHNCLKYVAPVRKALGTKTFFNMLGPLLNPVKTAKHFNGVYHCKVLTIYQAFLQAKQKQYFIYHSHNGYDEITLTDNVYCYTNNQNFTLTPNIFIPNNLHQNHAKGGTTAAHAATLFIQIIKGVAPIEKIKIVAVNAAVAIAFFNGNKNYLNYYNNILMLFKTGKVATHFQKIIDGSK